MSCQEEHIEGMLDDRDTDSGRGVSAGFGNHTQLHCPFWLALTALLGLLWLDLEITHNFTVLPAMSMRLDC